MKPSLWLYILWLEKLTKKQFILVNFLIIIILLNKGREIVSFQALLYDWGRVQVKWSQTVISKGWYDNVHVHSAVSIHEPSLCWERILRKQISFFWMFAKKAHKYWVNSELSLREFIRHTPEYLLLIVGILQLVGCNY